MKHASQFEAANVGLEPLGVIVDIARGGFVALAFRQLEKLRRIGDSLSGAFDLACIGRQTCPFATELLGALRLGPYGGIFQLARYLFEALLLEIVLKETPVRSRYAPRGL